MASYSDLINAGLLDVGDRREAGLMGLIALGQAIGNRGAARLSPTPPPLDLARPMAVYQNSMNAALQRGALAKKMKREADLRKLFAPSPVSEPEAQQIAERVFERTISGPMDVDETSDDMDNRGLDARYAALPAARLMTTRPEALRGLPDSLASGLSAIGQIDPELGAKTLAGLYKARAGATSPAAVREFEFYNTLSPKDQQRFLILKRALQNRNLGDRDVTLNPTDPEAPPLSSRRKKVSPDADPATRGRQAEATERGKAQGEAQAAQVPGSKAQIEETERKAALEARVKGINADRESMIEKIDRALAFLDQTDMPVTGFASYLASVPGTPAYQFSELIAPIRAFIGFDRLQQMRSESPTGGALGQVAVQELKDLQATKGSLAIGQRESDLRITLGDIKEKLVKANKARLEAVQKQLSSTPSAKNAQPPRGQPVTPDVLKQAQDAIGRGADPKKIKQRLRDLGYDVTGVNF